MRRRDPYLQVVKQSAANRFRTMVYRNPIQPLRNRLIPWTVNTQPKTHGTGARRTRDNTISWLGWGATMNAVRFHATSCAR